MSSSVQPAATATEETLDTDAARAAVALYARRCKLSSIMKQLDGAISSAEAEAAALPAEAAGASSDAAPTISVVIGTSAAAAADPNRR